MENISPIILATILVILIMIPFFVSFEKKEIKAEEIVIIGMLAAIAAISRIPFAALPSIQPTSFVIIISAMVFGPKMGFIIGACAAIVSNVFLGQGPWTIWQMFAWGLMGFSAGYIAKSVVKFKGSKPYLSIWKLSTFGFIWGYLFGWIMNIWVVLGLLETSWQLIMGVYLASFYFDLAHGVSNVIFIILMGNALYKILYRVKVKYGLLQ